jgi:alpha-L-rhamnosidase
MHAANAMVDFYRYTGDRAFAERVLPVVEKQLDFDAQLLDARGLIVTGPPGSRPDLSFLCCGLDWDPYDGPKVGAVASTNITYFHALRQAAYLEAHVGDRSRARALRADAARLRTAINATLFDRSSGLYRLSDTTPDVIPQDANALAVDFGVAPRRSVPGILDGIKQRLWTRFGTFPYSDQTRFKPVLSPFITGFEVQARLLAGDTADALDLMRRHFGAMLRPGPDDTGALWEKMTPEGGVDVEDGENPIDNNSLAHGWSAAPTALLSEHVLGVSPVDPGFGTWRFDPRPGDLRWAAGQVPTPAGPIRVAWHRARRPTRLRLTITAPAGTSGLMAAPVTAGTRAVTVDGRRVPVGQQIALTGGRRQHTITVVGR